METVTHPSINRAQRRLTLLIETDALPICQIAAHSDIFKWHCNMCILYLHGL